MNEQTQAAVLSAALASATIEPTARHRREVAALRLTVRRLREPLDLAAPAFLYRIDRDGVIQPLRELPTPFCRCR